MKRVVLAFSSLLAALLINSALFAAIAALNRPAASPEDAEPRGRIAFRSSPPPPELLAEPPPPEEPPPEPEALDLPEPETPMLEPDAPPPAPLPLSLDLAAPGMAKLELTSPPRSHHGADRPGQPAGDPPPAVALKQQPERARRGRERRATAAAARWQPTTLLPPTRPAAPAQGRGQRANPGQRRGRDGSPPGALGEQRTLRRGRSGCRLRLALRAGPISRSAARLLGPQDLLLRALRSDP